MPTERQPIPHLHAVILAGGSGARFWPLSRELSPKQMLSIFGGRSLITRAVERIQGMCDADAVHVLTNERLLDELRNHLTAQEDLDVSAIEFLAEPTPRNTAPAMALAAAHLAERDPDALMIMLPSDHLLEDGDRWQNTVRLACETAMQGYLVTIGLTPTAPETGYGYIQSGDPLEGLALGGLKAHRVTRFVEKPDLATAETYVADGAYMWNSGMLVARCADVLAAFEGPGSAGTTPDSGDGAAIARVARELAALGPDQWHTSQALDEFGALPSVPFDKAVLEVSDKVAVVPTSLDWSDVGSLLALGTLETPDANGNVLAGNVIDVDSHGTIAYSAERLVATLGLEDLLVVDTADATLVAHQSMAQDVRRVVDALKAMGAPEITRNRESLRPWGSWTLLMRSTGFQIKSIDVLPGHRLSQQSHEQRSEHWIVVEGTATIERDGDTITVPVNESAFIPMGCRHRLGNDTDTHLRVIEVAVGDYLEEDDIVRYEDDWGR